MFQTGDAVAMTLKEIEIYEIMDNRFLVPFEIRT